jgi:hypothetical protein
MNHTQRLRKLNYILEDITSRNYREMKYNQTGDDKHYREAVRLMESIKNLEEELNLTHEEELTINKALTHNLTFEEALQWK